MARFKLKKKGHGPRGRMQGADGPELVTRAVFLPQVPSITEDSHSAIHELLAGRDHQTMEELNAFLREQMQSGEINRRMNDPRDPRAKARSLAAEALRKRGTETGDRLAAEALAIDPECVDALLAQVPPGQADLERLREIVEIARRQLGPEVFENERGHFWGAHETRPFIRALQHLATACLTDCDYDGCAAACEEILAWNEKDNLGVRELMLTIHLRRGDQEAARALVARFPGIESAIWNWSIVLLESRFGRSELERMQALQDAIRINRHVLERLLGIADPGPVHAEAALGSKEEAENATVLLMRAIEEEPREYLEWLMRELLRAAKPGKVPSPPLS